ncbi:MAG: DUF1952 domain-containing protein [Planctomycetota bacterium]|jgi:hypothetical protein
MAEFSRDVRGIPLWLLRDYMVDEGGTAEGDTVVVGDGWRMTLTQLDDFRIGSLVVGEIRVELDGDPDAIARILPILEQKLVRAGG